MTEGRTDGRKEGRRVFHSPPFFQCGGQKHSGLHIMTLRTTCGSSVNFHDKIHLNQIVVTLCIQFRYISPVIAVLHCLVSSRSLPLIYQFCRCQHHGLFYALTSSAWRVTCMISTPLLRLLNSCFRLILQHVSTKFDRWSVHVFSENTLVLV